MQKDFTTAELSRWIAEFNNNDPLPFVTKSALIELKDLEEFISIARKQQADSVRIYFLRFSLNDTPTAKALIDGKIAKGCNWHEAANGLTQATIAMVPAKNFKLDDDFIFSADDIILDNKISTLMPGIGDKGTGLNPPPPGIENITVGPTP